MACDCEHSSLKTYARLDLSQNPPVVVAKAYVQIDSVCGDNTDGGGGGEGDLTEPLFVDYRQQQQATQQTEPVDANAGLCFNYITVTLLRADNGWRITELQVGGDTFSCLITAGKSERFALGPCESCIIETASVKLSDQQGVKATLGGFKVCHCQTA